MRQSARSPQRGKQRVAPAAERAAEAKSHALRPPARNADAEDHQIVGTGRGVINIAAARKLRNCSAASIGFPVTVSAEGKMIRHLRADMDS